MTSKRKCVKWGSSGLLVKLEDDALRIEGSFNVEVRPRGVVFEQVKSYRVASDERKKYIYVEHEELKPADAVNCSEELDLGKYVISSVDLGFEEYVTVTTPGESLIDYLVLTRRISCIVVSRKREPYFDLTQGTLAIYLV
ncbi:hypothetical protein [Thermogladius sp.]|uniref:hypothetical protein n=1 Tax=Thermogladius sp. TaxID=2023064 RepID=UPI003D127FCB